MRRHRLAIFALIALTSTACATAMSVSSHVEPALDVSRYHTYDWGPADALPSGDPRLDKNPFFIDHLEGAVEKAMARKGYGRATSQPDLQLHYHAVIDRRLDVNRVDREHGFCFDGNCDARVLEYEAGTLVLDIVDAKTQRLIWRGWAQNPMAGLLDNNDRLARQVETAVARMLARFPGSI